MSRIAIIETCGGCPHYQDGVCAHTAFDHLSRGKLTRGAMPAPDWCPLLRADEVAQVKPLEWSTIRADWHEAGPYTIQFGPASRFENGWDRWEWCGAYGQWQPCESLEAGKAACEAAYRAALFGPQGPLVQIGDAGNLGTNPVNQKANA